MLDKKIAPESTNLKNGKKKNVNHFDSAITVIIVRFCVLVYLVSVTIGFGATTYILLREYEKKLALLEYDSSAEDLLFSARNRMDVLHRHRS